jgi:hypothetical protein
LIWEGAKNPAPRSRRGSGTSKAGEILAGQAKERQIRKVVDSVPENLPEQTKETRDAVAAEESPRWPGWDGMGGRVTGGLLRFGNNGNNSRSLKSTPAVPPASPIWSMPRIAAFAAGNSGNNWNRWNPLFSKASAGLGTIWEQTEIP